MKQLFLTSSANKVLDIIVPYLLDKPENLKVVFIPTAANPYSEKPWVDHDRDKLKELGFQVFDLDLEDKDTTEIESFLGGKDIIFVAGGNTFYLLEQIQKSGFDKIVADWVISGKLYIGSSAGSVVVGPDVESVEIFDDREESNLQSTKGLSFIDSVILPHYTQKEFKKYNDEVVEKFKSKYKFILLEDNQFVLVQGEKLEVIS